MPLDPFLAPLLANLPPLPDHIDDFDAFRAQETAGADALVDQLMEPGPEVASEQTISIPVEDGVIDLVVFQPFTDGPHPAHLYIHGGGWISGSAHSRATANTCRERAIGADCTVIAIEYRKAPEHPFPTALNDCFAALTWVANHADELGIRPELITVGGGSAGANLAAALTLKSRDEGGPAIAFQLLEVPALDLTLASPSLQENGTGYDLTLDAIRKLAALYLPSSDDATNPYASPLLAPGPVRATPRVHHVFGVRSAPRRRRSLRRSAHCGGRSCPVLAPARPHTRLLRIHEGHAVREGLARRGAHRAPSRQPTSRDDCRLEGRTAPSCPGALTESVGMSAQMPPRERSAPRLARSAERCNWRNLFSSDLCKDSDALRGRLSSAPH